MNGDRKVGNAYGKQAERKGKLQHEYSQKGRQWLTKTGRKEGQKTAMLSERKAENKGKGSRKELERKKKNQETDSS